MLRVLLLVVGLFSGAAFAETVVPLTIGGQVIRVAVDDGYVQSSTQQPTLFAAASAAMPPGNRLVEQFVTAADAKRILLSQTMDDDYLQVQVLRDAENVKLSAADWASARPKLIEQLGGLNINKLTKPMQAGIDKRVSASTGSDVTMKFGQIGKPSIYGDFPDSVRFTVLLPITATVNGKPHQVQLECAGSVVLLNGKMLYAYAYRSYRPEDKNMLGVRTALDHFLDRARALNAGTKSIR